MAELGAHTAAAHQETGLRAAELSVDQLFTVGKMAGVTAGAARAAGLKAVEEFADVETATVAVKKFLKAGDVMLLKASRAARIERLGEALKS
jgi:UDP-N-acetylmuramoyl-tripeptide--D-alanyl-D-alanine ligase